MKLSGMSELSIVLRELQEVSSARFVLLIVVITWFQSAPSGAAEIRDGKVPRVGFLSINAQPPNPGLSGFKKGMDRLGYVDGQDYILELRSAAGDAQRLPELAVELANLPVDIIIAGGPEATLRAAVQATDTIPIVTMAGNYNPLAKGYVKSLANSATNITGVYLIQVTLSAKRLALLKETLPELTRVAALWDEHTADQYQSTHLAASDLGIELQSIELKDPPYDFKQALSEIDAQAVTVLSSPNFLRQRSEVIDAVAGHRLPAIYIFSHFVHAGGLMAYGANLANAYADTASYVDKILSGVETQALPMQEPTEFEFVINLKTAKTLGLTLPPSILLQATELIE